MEELAGATGDTDAIVDTLSGDVAESVKFYLAAGVSQGALATAFGVTAVQIKAVATQVKEAEDAYKLWAKTEADLATQLEKHAKDQRAADNKRGEEKLAAEAASFKTLEGLRERAHDLANKQSMDATTYQINKIWEKAEAEIKAFDSTDDKMREHTDLVYTLADAEARGITDVMAVAVDRMAEKAAEGLDKVIGKAEAASYTINSIFSVGGSGADMEARAKALGGMVNRDDYGNPYIYIPGVNAPGHRAAGGPVSAGEPYWTGERGPELFVPSTSGAIVPHGGGVVVNATIYVNGTAEDVARQVADQLLRRIKAGQQLGAN
jgi:hypothetical protein